jgi:hypothetical protein
VFWIPDATGKELKWLSRRPIPSNVIQTLAHKGDFNNAIGTGVRREPSSRAMSKNECAGTDNVIETHEHAGDFKES